MKKTQLLNCAMACAFVFAPHMALAQPSVTDPAAAVPSVVYQSVFVDAPKGVETGTNDWKNVNAEVGQFRRGHVDILKWEESQFKAPPKGNGKPPDATNFAAPDTHNH